MNSSNFELFEYKKLLNAQPLAVLALVLKINEFIFL